MTKEKRAGEAFGPKGIREMDVININILAELHITMYTSASYRTDEPVSSSGAARMQERHHSAIVRLPA